MRLSLPSPWSFLGQDHGLVGSPNDFEWYDGAVWLASSRGLQRMTGQYEDLFARLLQGERP